MGAERGLGDLERLDAFVDDARAAEAVDARRRERRLTQIATEDADLAGTLRDLAETRATVTVRTTSGHVHSGALRGVGPDVVVLRMNAETEVFVPLSAIAQVTPDAAVPVSAAAGEAAMDGFAARLADLLAARLDDRPRVRVFAGGAEPIAGELRAVGRDVLTIRMDGSARLTSFVPIPAVSELFINTGG